MTSDEEGTMHEPRIAPRIPLRELEGDTLEEAAAGPMQRRADPVVDPGPEWRNAPAGAAASTYVPPGIMALLAELTWVHELNLRRECEGCANDGEPGYCRGAWPGWEQQDVREAGEEDEPPPILCHCGHAVVAIAANLARSCGCNGPAGWHCPGEDSEHWAQGEDPDAECGHCGAHPSDAEE